MSILSYYASDTKRGLLMLIKQRGAASLDDAVRETGLTRTTLREHLGQLERDGLVDRTTNRRGRGRPSLSYSLTPKGERLFPTHDGLLLGGLLEFLKQQNRDDLLRAFFEQFWDERFQEVSARLDKEEADDLAARARVLEELLREQGFMPEVSLNADGIAIRECNCPFPEAVRHTRLPCRLEAKFFERLFGERIGRVAYIPDGSPACTYEFPDSSAADT